MGKLIFIILVLVSKVSYSAAALPHFEVRTAPIAYLWQWYTFDFSYLINSNWAAGPSYIDYGNKSEYGNMFLPVFNGKALGAHAIWSESFVVDAYYASLHYYNEDYTSHGEGFSGHYDNTGTKANVDIGKRWIPYPNVSGMVGVGYEIYSHTQKKVSDFAPPVTTEKSSGFLHIEFKLGYFF